MSTALSTSDFLLVAVAVAEDSFARPEGSSLSLPQPTRALMASRSKNFFKGPALRVESGVHLKCDVSASPHARVGQNSFDPVPESPEIDLNRPGSVLGVPVP